MGGKVETQVQSWDEAVKQGLFDFPGYNLSGQSGLTGLTGAKQIRCGTCGYSEREFEKTGRLGCAQCYETFGKYLHPLLRRMHRGDKHVGKTPGSEAREVVQRNRLRYLEGEMESAIRRERFEEAAQMRDQIRELRGEQPRPPA